MPLPRETMPVDVLFVGGGPASLAGAIRLMELVQKHNEDVQAGRIQGEVYAEPAIAVIEKGSEIGSHAISGAVLDPRSLDELVPDWRKDPEFPVERFIERESFVFLTPTMAFPAPLMPPEFKDHGKPIISIGRFQKWLAAKAEAMGVMVFPGFAGAELLFAEDGKVKGVRTGDKGVGADGRPKSNFEPGMDLEAKVTILGEGPRGHLARQLMRRFGLQEGRNEMAYETGCKEVIELPEGSVKDGWVMLTAGYPLGETFGGAFLYSLGGDRVAIGLLASLDAADPALDVHYELQKLKMHPYIREILGKGKVVKYGAKTVTVGGWGCMPKLHAPGAMLIGDTASFLNASRIKGIHLAMKSGMLAAEAAFNAWKLGDTSDESLSLYKKLVDASWIREEMEESQNFHAGMSKLGLVGGAVKYGLAKVFGPGKIEPVHPDHEGMQRLSHAHPSNKMPARDEVPYDNVYLVDKLTDVFLSGTKHDEHQPSHLIISDPEVCATRCAQEYGNPCERFCPAQVYNMVTNEKTGKKEMRVDFSNCVHCKTCDIRDPYQIIQWVPTSGGEGPEYGNL